MKQVIELSVNGEPYEVAIHPHRTLLEVLREEIGLTGPKEGCGLGACGACTVLIDGEAVLACLTLALSVEGKAIQTVEGLAEGQELSVEALSGVMAVDASQWARKGAGAARAAGKTGSELFGEVILASYARRWTGSPNRGWPIIWLRT